MTSARILTVRQPWAWAIIHGQKDVENRVRNLAGDYRGPVLIHVAKAEDMSAMGPAPHPALNAAKDAWFPSLSITHQRTVTQHPWREWFGHIIGLVDLTAVHGVDEVGCMAAIPDCSPWAEKTEGTHHLVLANPRALDEPIPYTGALGLRKTKFHILEDWLAEEADRCTCGGGDGWPGHEPMCGVEAVARLVATS